MRGFCCVGLHQPKDKLNVGSVLRAAGCYSVALVALGGSRPHKYMGRMQTDTQKAYRHVPTILTDDLHDVIPYDCVPIAVDLVDGATSLVEYKHPERAFYIFGPEDGTLDGDMLKRCWDSVYVPTKHCMNLAATVNVILYDRMAKQIGESND